MGGFVLQRNTGELIVPHSSTNGGAVIVSRIAARSIITWGKNISSTALRYNSSWTISCACIKNLYAISWDSLEALKPSAGEADRYGAFADRVVIRELIVVAIVLACIGDQNVFAVWQEYHLWSFPYYGAGAILTAIVLMSSSSVTLYHGLITLPVLYGIYQYFRLAEGRSRPAVVRV